MTKRHRHRAIKAERRDKCFFGCANPECCKPETHGGITIIDTCRCGAKRHTNSNGGQRERGDWYMPTAR